MASCMMRRALDLLSCIGGARRALLVLRHVVRAGPRGTVPLTAVSQVVGPVVSGCTTCAHTSHHWGFLSPLEMARPPLEVERPPLEGEL
jgi:hypothetical protein